MSEKSRGWRAWLGPVIASVVLSLMVVGAVIAVNVYHWKGSDVGWLLVGLIALGVINVGTMLEGIPALGWIVMITGGVLWLKIQDTREVLERHLREIQEDLTTEIRERKGSDPRQSWSDPPDAF